MKIYIKNLNCPLFLHFIKSELEKIGIPYTKLEMREVEVADDLSDIKLNQLRIALLNFGLEVDIDYRCKIVSKIKTFITKYLDNQKLELEMSLPKFIGSKIDKDYTCLNTIFLEETGMSIEKYYRWRKVNMAIKLLTYYNLTLNEITYQLNYKNERELLREFKNEIGVIPNPKYQFVKYQ